MKTFKVVSGNNLIRILPGTLEDAQSFMQRRWPSIVMEHVCIFCRHEYMKQTYANDCSTNPVHEGSD